jgi:hypothetical protein
MIRLNMTPGRPAWSVLAVLWLAHATSAGAGMALLPPEAPRISLSEAFTPSAPPPAQPEAPDEGESGVAPRR